MKAGVFGGRYRANYKSEKTSGGPARFFLETIKELDFNTSIRTKE